jgi:diguanylate cyclase (GGDEF)-like protein
MVNEEINKLEDRLRELRKDGASESNKEKVVDVLNDLSYAYYTIDPKKAREYALNAREEAEKVDYIKGIGRSYIVEGISFWTRGNYKRSKRCHKKALKFYSEINDEDGIGTAYNNIGLVSWREGKLTEAIENYQKSLKIFKQINNINNEGSTNVNIGIIYAARNEFDKALDYYYRALEIFKETGNKKYSANTYDNIGNVFIYKEDFKNSIKYYKKSLKLRIEIDDPGGVSYSYQKLGVAYNEFRDYQKSLEYQLKSIEIMKKIGDDYHIVYSHKGIAEVYIRLKQYDEALNHLLKALKISRKNKSDNQISDMLLTLSYLYEKKGDYKKCFEYYKKYTELKDKVYTREFNEKIAEMEVMHEVERKEKEAEIHRLKNVELKKEIDERKRVEEELRKSEERFRKLSIEDPLTGVFNRRYFYEIGEKTLKRAINDEVEISIAMFDIDHFKNINDTYGHQTGDEVLRGFVSIVKENIRPDDIIARYGGEEFALLLNRCSIERASSIVERIRSIVEDHTFKSGDNEIDATVSAGVSMIDEIKNTDILLDDLIKIADDRLYRAKETGRYKVVIQ